MRTQRAAGVAGILAGVGLAVEFAFWTASGWTPRTWSDPAGALAFLDEHGDVLRAGVFAGVANLAFVALLLVGLARRLRDRSPTLGPATLHFGVIGIGGHALVPIALWLGIPMLLTMPDATARSGWVGFAMLLTAAGGVGSLFLGLSMLAAGLAAIRGDALPSWLGWVAILAGTTSALTVLTAATPLGVLAGSLYLPSLLLAITFRVAAGIHLVRSGS